MKSSLPVAVIAGALAVALVGCTFPSSRRTVSRGTLGSMSVEHTGIVTNVRQVNVEGQRTNLGLIGGAALGGAAASGGSGVGGAVAQAGGAVVGAIAGQAVEESVTRKQAQEITIRLDDGRTVVVTQEVATGIYQDGDRVRVLDGGGGARVSLATN